VNIKKVLIWAGLLCSFMFLSGCFYLRLQRVKGQLAEFETYFEIKKGEKFSIIAKEPVLFSADLVRIMKTEPVFKSQVGDTNEFYYDYIFEKLYPAAKDEGDNYDITFRLMFTEDKLSEARIDKKFFAVIPEAVFVSIIKALGKSAVDRKHRRISMSGEAIGAEEIHVPDVNEVVLLLGRPYAKDGLVYSYKYARKRPDSVSVSEKDCLPVVFTFNKEGKFLKCKSELLGGVLEADFSSFPHKKKAEIRNGNSAVLSNDRQDRSSGKLRGGWEGK